MVESELVAPGSLEGVLSGKHYNHCVRAHKVVYEAMQRLRFLAFLQSLPEAEAQKSDVLGRQLVDAAKRGTIPDACTTSDFSTLKNAFDEYVAKRKEENPTFALWSTYIDVVQLLLLFIRATRTSDWNLHLSALRSMLPWFFATDRVNYSRYASCYWLEMSCLASTHPCKFCMLNDAPLLAILIYMHRKKCITHFEPVLVDIYGMWYWR